MAGAANAAFLNNIPICHLGSGIIGTSATFDNTFRHNISLMADIALCESERSAWKTKELWNTIDKIKPNLFHNIKQLEVFNLFYNIKQLEVFNIYVVGNPCLESLDKIDKSLIPKEPYDLILINSVHRTESGRGKKEIHFDTFKDFIKLKKEGLYKRKTIWIGSNPDYRIRSIPDSCEFYDNLPRPQFLGLLKYCTRYITNSSSVYYEAIPLGLKKDQIIIVGSRNNKRNTPTDWNWQNFKTSKRIVQILKEWKK